MKKATKCSRFGKLPQNELRTGQVVLNPFPKHRRWSGQLFNRRRRKTQDYFGAFRATAYNRFIGRNSAVMTRILPGGRSLSLLAGLKSGDFATVADKPYNFDQKQALSGSAICRASLSHRVTSNMSAPQPKHRRGGAQLSQTILWPEIRLISESIPVSQQRAAPSAKLCRGRVGRARLVSGSERAGLWYIDGHGKIHAQRQPKRQRRKSTEPKVIPALCFGMFFGFPFIAWGLIVIFDRDRSWQRKLQRSKSNRPLQRTVNWDIRQVLFGALLATFGTLVLLLLSWFNYLAQSISPPAPF